MEVNSTSFPHHLLGILIDISESDFVSFDLELSGIPSRIPGKSRLSRTRQTLEERYLECREGADRYQILQVGITCAKFEYEADKYILRPYNINISPLVEERLDIERDITFQTGAISFLLDHGFDFNLPFTDGVQYLSQEEARRAKQAAYARIDKTNVIDDLQIADDEKDTLDFLRRVREAISSWLKTSNHNLHITSNTGLDDPPTTYAITRYEKRLVHQLLRNEYQDLRAIPQTDHMIVIKYDVDREASHAKKMKERVKEQINKQTGFRWIIEALAGRSIAHIDPMYFAKNKDGMAIAADLGNIKARFGRATERLKNNQPFLVGHNMFTDLVYLYSTFIGELPATLDGFCSAVHELFPRIVDTKYLATYGGGDLNVSPTLQEIVTLYATQRLPNIGVHPNHAKYHATQALHEAGFDSLLTATIMLQLAAKLNDANYTASATKKKKKNKHRNRKSGDKGLGKDLTRKFATANLFEGLRAADQEALEKSSCDEPHDQAAAGNQDSNEDSPQDWENAPCEYYGKTYPINKIQRGPMELLPDPNSAFWEDLGNRLRVFGTKETELKIANWVKY